MIWITSVFLKNNPQKFVTRALRKTARYEEQQRYLDVDVIVDLLKHSTKQFPVICGLKDAKACLPLKSPVCFMD